MTTAKCQKCHRERQIRARGLCGPCYVYGLRSGRLRPLERRTGSYAEDLIEEISMIPTITWPRLEEAFDRPRKNLQVSLRTQGRTDLIRKIHRNTYDTVHQGEIASIVNRRQPPSRDPRTGYFKKEAA